MLDWIATALPGTSIVIAMILGAGGGSWERLRGVPTWVLVAVIAGGSTAVGIIDELFFDRLAHGWISVALLGSGWAWASRRPVRLRPAPDGSIGPASRAFARRER